MLPRGLRNVTATLSFDSDQVCSPLAPQPASGPSMLVPSPPARFFLASFFAGVFLFTGIACTSSQPSSRPADPSGAQPEADSVMGQRILVGHPPCDDTIRRNEAREIVDGCGFFPVVEATRSDAAPYTVHGRILIGGSLEPFPGAAVRVVGASRGTSTDSKGRFTIRNLRGSARLAIGAVGMWPDTLTVGSLPGPRVDPGRDSDHRP
jgi:hypothetical protein